MKVYVILEWVEGDFGGWHREFLLVTSDKELAETYKFSDDYEIEEYIA